MSDDKAPESQRKALDAMCAQAGHHAPPEDGWLIHKSGRGWYRPEAKGYTAHTSEAGRYSYTDAMAYSRPNGMDGPRDGITIKHESALPPEPPSIDAMQAEIAALKAERGQFRAALLSIETSEPWVSSADDLREMARAALASTQEPKG